MQRNQYFDYVKGITIVLVVLGHCIQFGSGSAYLQNLRFYDNEIYKFIYGFHMPLLIFISGFFFARTRNKNDTFSLLLKKIKTIFIPILCWNTVGYIQKCAIGITNFTIKGYLLTLVSESWFLWALLVCMCVDLLIFRCSKYGVLIALSGIILLQFVPDLLHSNLYVYMIPYHTLGDMVGALYIDNKNRIARPGIVLVVCSLIGYFTLLFFFKQEHYIYVSGTCFNGAYLKQGATNLFRWITGGVGITQMLLVTQALFRFGCFSMIKKFLIELGEQSMGIYMVSILLNQYLKLITSQLEGLSVGICTLEMVVIVFMSYLLSKVLGHFKICNVLFLGGRAKKYGNHIMQDTK